MKKETSLRKPFGILLFLLGLLLSAVATIPVCAQIGYSPAAAERQAAFEKHWFHSSGRNQQGEAPELNNYYGRDMSPDTGVPGARLAREAYVDIYAHNYNGAIPLLQKGVQAGNDDAMLYLSYCNFYGFGVPVDRAKALQLMRMAGIANARRVARIDREQQEERARAARAFERQVEKAASSSSYQSTPAKSQGFKGPLVLTPWGLKARTPFTSTWDTTP